MKKRFIVFLLLSCFIFLVSCQPKSQCEIEGHDIINHKAKEVTCLEDGYDAYETCSRCEYTTLSIITALGHDYTNYEGKYPTCSTMGYHPYGICKRCNFSNIELIPKLEHIFIDYKCTLCDKDYANYLKIGTTTNLKVSNDNEGYSFYMSQKDTGKYSSENCGPACTYMACKWVNENFSFTVADIRNINVKPADSDYGWFPQTIIQALETYDVKCDLVRIDQKSETYNDMDILKLRNLIDEGKLLIICFNCKDITSDILNKRVVGQAYSGGNSGHFILVKGYIVVDNKLYFEIYDPALPLDYNNPILKTDRTRYYDAIQLLNSSLKWNNNVVVVSK